MPESLSGMALNAKQQCFVAEYLVDLNATQAAIRAGYSRATARSQGQRLLTNVDIATAIDEAMQERAKRVQITQDDVLGEALILLQSDVRNYQVDPDSGDLILRDGAPETAWRAVSSVKRRRIVTGDPEDPTIIHEIELKLWDKPSIIKLTAQHRGLLITKVEHSGSLSLEDLITRSRDPEVPTPTRTEN